MNLLEVPVCVNISRLFILFCAIRLVVCCMLFLMHEISMNYFFVNISFVQQTNECKKIRFWINSNDFFCNFFGFRFLCLKPYSYLDQYKSGIYFSSFLVRPSTLLNIFWYFLKKRKKYPTFAICFPPVFFLVENSTIFAYRFFDAIYFHMNWFSPSDCCCYHCLCKR